MTLKTHSRRSFVAMAATGIATAAVSSNFGPKWAHPTAQAATLEATQTAVATLPTTTLSENELLAQTGFGSMYGQAAGQADGTAEDGVPVAEFVPPAVEPMLTLQSAKTANFTRLDGADRFETSAKIADAAFDSCTYAVIASGENFPDALSVTALAGALECPVLLTAKDSIPDSVAEEIRDLDVENIIIVGGTAAVSKDVEATLKLGSDVTRLSGDDRYETSMKIYQYGVDNDLWANVDTFIVATGASFPDAVSVSPLAYAAHMPIILVDPKKGISDEKREMLVTDGFTKALVVGGTSVISSEIRSSLYDNGVKGERLSGANRYETSVAIAQYAVTNGILSWNNVAFATGTSPYDALAGGALQGSDGSVILLTDSNIETAIDCAASHQSSISNIRILGGVNAISDEHRADLQGAASGETLPSNCSYRTYSNVTFNAMATAQANRYNSPSTTLSDLKDLMDPDNYPYDSKYFYQFAKISAGYSGRTASEIDAYLNSTTNGASGKLAGQGSAFVAAAKEYGINEIYLMAHAILESAWGTSGLAKGYTPEEISEWNRASWYSTRLAEALASREISDADDEEKETDEYKDLYEEACDEANELADEDVEAWLEAGVVTIDSVDYEFELGQTYHNFFGIGAVDTNATNGGWSRAVMEGWDTPTKAVKGAGAWVAKWYTYRTLAQDTLWLMKWDAAGYNEEKTLYHEYATGTGWAKNIGAVMASFYDFNGQDASSSDLSFVIPAFG